MEIIIVSIVVIILQFSFIVYQDISNRRERERLQLKLMSKDVAEYKTAVEPTPKNTPTEKKPSYVDPMEVDPEKILTAKDNL